MISFFKPKYNESELDYLARTVPVILDADEKISLDDAIVIGLHLYMTYQSQDKNNDVMNEFPFKFSEN